jgi:16S rRNA (guanine527-N7)-methyltransferase
LNILCELCLPFVSVGGIFIAMKSIDSDKEINEAQSAIATLGAKMLESYDYKIPDTDVTHRAVLIRKDEKTPSEYPRRFAKIKRNPL